MASLADRTWLDAAPTRRLMEAFDTAGIAFRFVGGAVRDTLLGRDVADVDIDVATPAPPDATMHALQVAGLKAIPTGIVHGTVTAVADGRHFEITTLRRDVETDGRHAIVEFTDDWREDAARRDFTMNALYADRDGRIEDYFSGVEDARAGHVRFIGDPSLRIVEDALRILRFFRFHAHYGKGEPDPVGLSACAEFAPMIDRLSGERVRDEILKLLAAPDPTAVWHAMVLTEVMPHVIAFATRTDDLANLVAAEGELGLEIDPLRRLAALIGPVPVTEIALLKRRLKLSNRDETYLRTLESSDERVALVVRGSFGQAAYHMELGPLRDAVLLAHLRSGYPDRVALFEFARFIEDWRDPRFPIAAADLAARGIAAGPDMGRLLADFEQWWVAKDFQPDRQSCLAKLDQLLFLRRSRETT